MLDRSRFGLRRVRRHGAAWVVLAVGLAATAALDHYVAGVLRTEREYRFREASEGVVRALADRLEAYAGVLRAARGLFPGGAVPSREEFHAFFESVAAPRHYPGIQGAGFVRAVPGPELVRHEEAIQAQGYPEYQVWPAGSRPLYGPISFIEPTDPPRRRILGFDMFLEPTRRAAMERARDTGDTAATAPLELIRESRADRQPGFLIYLAVYRGHPATVEERRAALVGWVYEAFRAPDLLRATLGGHPPRGIDLEIQDGEGASPAALLYDSSPGPRLLGTRSDLRRATRVMAADRPWTLSFAAAPGFEPPWQRWFPLGVAGVGLVVTLLVFAITRREAHARAEAETAEARAAILAEAGKRLSSSLEYRAALGEVAALAARALDCDCAVDLTEEGGTVRLARRPDGSPAPSFPVAPDAPWCASVVAGGAAQLIADTRNSGQGEARQLREAGIRSALCVPIAARRERLGALTLVATETRLDDSALDFAVDVADLVAGAVENVRLFLQAQQAVRARDEFLSIAAHELKTPVTALALQAHSLERAATPEAVPQRAEGIRRNVGRLAKLIDNLLDISRITAGRLDLELQEVDLAAVAREVAGRLSAELAQAGCTLAVRADGPVTGLWDPLRLEQVVTNLLGNAAKYGRGRPVEVTVSTADGVARLSVRDEGIGIPPEDQQRIFERFERAVPGRAAGGLGLGLWIVRQIVEALGGTIEVDSVPGKGSTFTVRLPRYPRNA